jgi:hypothetical protein
VLRVSLLCSTAVLVLLCLLASGCGSADIPPSVDIEPPGRATTNDASLPECEVVFSPGPELEAETRSAASRWSAATGCDIHLGDGGLPIHAEPYVYDPSARRVCGLSTWDDSRVSVQTIAVAMVDLSCLPPYTVLHEMGHALAGIQGHALAGVMAPGSSKAKSTRIDTASLDFVCGGLRCAERAPEVTPP